MRRGNCVMHRDYFDLRSHSAFQVTNKRDSRRPEGGLVQHNLKLGPKSDCGIWWSVGTC